MAPKNLIHRRRVEPMPRPSDERFSHLVTFSMNESRRVRTAQLNRSEIVTRDSTESHWVSLLFISEDLRSDAISRKVRHGDHPPSIRSFVLLLANFNMCASQVKSAEASWTILLLHQLNGKGEPATRTTDRGNRSDTSRQAKLRKS